MRTRSFKIATLLVVLALAAVSSLALADPPARVGRVSLVQGQVSVSGEVGEEASPALLNWPVTSQRQLTTGRDARTEFRVGSTAVRLDGDSALEIVELDDNSLRMHLHYGSVSIRIRDIETARGFELSTPQGHVRLQEPGRLRVDAERMRDTTAVNVFDGVAQVDGGGMTLTVRAGKRAELINDDVKTGLAVRDSFDDWARLRDQQDERSVSARYVTTDMTGYEELDRNGIWRDDAEYGPIWMPRAVPVGWVPYRDGRWTWIAPWGWTWVDNAPWGYAPFHYGRWVFLNQRWCWTPGRHVSRPVWAPALVGWVGGNGWNVSFASRSHPVPAQGWYPLTPRDTFVPGYRMSPEHLRRMNEHGWKFTGREREHDRDGDHRRDGLTVVPHEQFNQRGVVVVRDVPKATVPAVALQHAPVAAPPAPRFVARDARGDRKFDRDGAVDRDGVPRGQRPGQQGVVVTAPPPGAAVPVGQRPPVVSSVQPVVSGPAPAALMPLHRDARPAADDPRREGRPPFDDQRRQRPPALHAAPVPVQQAGAPAAVAAPAAQPQVSPQQLEQQRQQQLQQAQQEQQRQQQERLQDQQRQRQERLQDQQEPRLQQARQLDQQRQRELRQQQEQLRQQQAQQQLAQQQDQQRQHELRQQQEQLRQQQAQQQLAQQQDQQRQHELRQQQEQLRQQQEQLRQQQQPPRQREQHQAPPQAQPQQPPAQAFSRTMPPVQAPAAQPAPQQQPAPAAAPRRSNSPAVEERRRRLDGDN